MDEEQRYRVRIVVKSLSDLKGFAVDTGCMPCQRREDGLIELEAIVSDKVLAALYQRRKKPFSIEVLGNRSEEAAEARKATSTTNRYADGSLPIGPGSRRQRVP